MDGIFTRPRFGVFRILTLASGLYLAGLFGYLLLSGQQGRGICLFFLILGLITVAADLLPPLLNRGAYFHVRDGQISARFGFGARLRCPLEEITDAFCRENELYLVRQDKIIIVWGLANCQGLLFYIRRLLPDNPPPPRWALASALNRQRLTRRRMNWVIAALFLAAAGCIAALLIATGGKELALFTARERQLGLLAGGAVLLLLAAALALAHRTVRLTRRILLNEHRLTRRLLLDLPLPEGPVLAVFTDPGAILRYTLLGRPDGPEVCYTEEGLCEDGAAMETLFTSPLYPDRQQARQALLSDVPFARDISRYFHP